MNTKWHMNTTKASEKVSQVSVKFRGEPQEYSSQVPRSPTAHPCLRWAAGLSTLVVQRMPEMTSCPFRMVLCRSRCLVLLYEKDGFSILRHFCPQHVSKKPSLCVQLTQRGRRPQLSSCPSPLLSRPAPKPRTCFSCR